MICKLIPWFLTPFNWKGIFQSGQGRKGRFEENVFGCFLNPHESMNIYLYTYMRENMESMKRKHAPDGSCNAFLVMSNGGTHVWVLSGRVTKKQ